MTQAVLSHAARLLLAKNGARMPWGAKAHWRADETVSSPRMYLKNSVATSAQVDNYYSASRRLFTNGNFWQGTLATVVDDAALGVSGNMDATTVDGAANWRIGSATDWTIPAGTWTLGATVKRNDTTDQSFAFTGSGGAGRSSAKTAGANYDRYSHTFTLGSPGSLLDVWICASDASTPAKLCIDNLELYDGASDLGPQAPAGHILFGVNGFDDRPSYASGLVDLTAAGALGVAQFAENSTVSEWTAMACGSKTAIATAYHGFLSKIQSFTSFTAFFERNQNLTYDNGTPAIAWNGTTEFFESNVFSEHLWNWKDRGAWCAIARYDGTRLDYFVNDILLFSAEAPASSVVLRDFFIGCIGGTANSGGYKISSVHWYERACANSECRRASQIMRSRAALNSVPLASFRTLAAEGDSESTGQENFLCQYAASTLNFAIGVIDAVSGAAMADGIGRAAQTDGVVPTLKGGRDFPLTIWFGANDVSSGPGATPADKASDYLSRYAAYCDARRAVGRPVIVIPILPRFEEISLFNSVRNIVNAAILDSWVGVHCDATIDYTLYPELWADGQNLVTTYFKVDQVHLNNDGEGLLATIIAPLLDIYTT